MNKKIKEVINLANKYNLKLDAESISFNDSSLDFKVAFAIDTKGTSWVLKLPKRPDVLEALEKEKNVLDFLKNKISIAVPD